MTTPFAVQIVEERNPKPGLITAVEHVQDVVWAIAAECDVPSFSLTVVLTGDITASVQRYGEPGFQPERLGGTVAGKTLPQRRDFTDTVIVVGVPDNDDFDLLNFLHITAHEHGHLLLSRLRADTGTRPPRPTRPQTFTEMARILAYEAADEYRCNILSNDVLGTTLITTDGGRRPLHLGDLFEGDYHQAYLKALDSTVYPGWPDLVDAYRTHELTLEDMVNRLIGSTDQVLKLAAHTTSVDHARGALLAPDAPEHGHRAVSRYLGPAWYPIRDLLRANPGIPHRNDFARIDRDIQSAGERIADMWARLGVSALRTADDGLDVTVTAPSR
ncbi:hypothetical protein GCM10023205_03950 [Yinghuangia aomiensis]|uniref:Uncharacterized protein n=1 Tax=Yinghuangia aomiensis TaxID=676205 RepID=A0ABP9GQE2_9ACTN